MKKNVMMRVASVLLIAVLMSTCVISGTFAKYTTSDTGSDSARVAKFGVTITIADDMGMFDTQYNIDETGEDATSLSLAAQADTELVAPGTKGSMSFSITGTPEVATRISVSTENSETIKLEAGTYTLGAGKFDNDETSVTLEGDATYEPIKFYFGETEINENTNYNLSFDELTAALANLGAVNDPGTELDKTYYIGWSWAFENTDENADFFDTYLAQEATAQEIVLNLTISVEQID